MQCDEATEHISLALDGAIDPTELEDLGAHVATCPSCQAFQQSSLRVRQHLRYEVVAEVPDVEAAVLDAVRRPAPKHRARRPSLRWLAPAAALLAGIVAGATFIGVRSDQSSDVAVAADLSSRILSAQLRVDALDANVEITERGWTPEVPVRTYQGNLVYRAPESLAITLEDTSSYPSKAWQPNDVTTIIDRDQAWRGGLSSCPRESQPTCTPDQLRILGTTDREPFPDASPAPLDLFVATPLDLVVPVGSFAGGGKSVTLGERAIDGHEAIGVEVTVAQVAPLLDGILANGNWREVNSTDRVELWLDRQSLVPLQLEIVPAKSLERERWAAHRGYTDDPATPVLEMRLNHVRIDTSAPAEFPSAPLEALERSQGFTDLAPEQVAAPTPGFLPEGMSAYRSGVVETPSGPGVDVRTWTDGRAWLKLRSTREWPGGQLFGDLGEPVREVALGPAGVAYVGDGGRRVALHGSGIDLVVTGSVSRAALLEVTETLGVHGEPVPATWSEADTKTIEQAAIALPGVLVPRTLPGFSEPAIRVDDDVITVACTGAGSRSFELFEAPGEVLTPPTDPDVRGVRVRHTTGRYSPEHGELEWIENGIALNLRSDSLSLGELLRIAARLRPA
jgi:Putative zinc-finger